MDAWAFADADPDADPGAEAPADDTTQDAQAGTEAGTVEDMAVGKLRLWLRGMFGAEGPR